MVAELLAEGRIVVVDNTNPAPRTGPRSSSWPGRSASATRNRLVPPAAAEGFERVDVVR